MSHPIKKTLEQAETIAIFGHKNIDGDCIWSWLWLWKVLEKLGKNVEYFTPIAPEDNFNFIPWINKRKDTFDYTKKYDVIVFVDFTPYSRIGKFTENNEEYFDQNTLCIIDHHHWEHVSHAQIIKDTNVASCAELVYENIKQRRPDKLDSEIASCFYLGLMTDSGNFMYGADNTRIFRNAMELLALWADKKTLTQHIFYSNTFDWFKFNAKVIERTQVEKWVLHTYFSTQEVEELSIDKETADAAFIQSQAVKWPEIYVRLMNTGTTIRWSTRANGFATADCEQICRELFNGWWHKKAAWFEVPLTKDFHTQYRDIIDAIISKINQPWQ